MSYSRTGPNSALVFECDACPRPEPRTLESEFNDLSRAIGEVKASGWEVRRVGQFYSHVCPSCVSEGRASLREKLAGPLTPRYGAGR